MRNTTARRILEETPEETRQFVKRYGELVTRIYDLLEEKGWTQKDLALRLGKKPSEISKWLSGKHNLTLRSLAKLEVELGEDLIQVPKTHKFKVYSSNVVHLSHAPSSKSIPSGEAGYAHWTPSNLSAQLSVA